MLILIIVSLIAVMAFCVLFKTLNIVQIGRNTTDTLMSGVSAMMDSELNDDQKELAVRKAGVSLIVASFNLFLRFALCLGAAALIIVITDHFNIANADAVFSLMLRVDYIIIVSISVILLSMLTSKFASTKQDSGTKSEEYTASERFIHSLAFSGRGKTLKLASSIEDTFIKAPAKIPEPKLVFVTSLARGGTTALLNALYDMPGFVTHTYRDMPFVTAPILWDKLAGGASRNVQKKQRAHGDGLTIDLNTPEAFEEVIWKIFWPQKYDDNNIALWTSEDNSVSAETFLKQHIRKIAYARLGKNAQSSSDSITYVSKNNANIARIPYLAKVFPEAKFVIPLRHPKTHTASLLRQHTNFTKRQTDDDFVRRYMRDIGHHEFGKIHLPMAFPGFDANVYDKMSLNYWLSYWFAAFDNVEKHRELCIFIDQDDLRSAPQKAMLDLLDKLDVDHVGVDFTRYFRSGPDTTDVHDFDNDLMDKCIALYERLRRGNQ